MNSTEILGVIEKTFCKPMAGWSTESLQALAFWEVAYQLAVANEREAEKKKEYHWDFTQSPPTKIGPANPVPLLPAFPYPHYEPRYPSVPYQPNPSLPTITCSKPLASGSTACQSDWIQTTGTNSDASTIEAEGKISD